MNTNELNASAASKSFECQQNPPSLISLISYPKVSEVSLPNSFDDDDDHLHFHQRNIENNNDQSNAVVPGKQDIVINNKLGLFYNHRQNTDKFYHHHRHHVSEQYNQEKDYAKLPEFYESSGNNVRRDNANYSPPLSRLRSRADDLLLLPRLVDDNSELLPISLSGGRGVASDPLTSYDYSKYRYFYRDINSSDVTGPAAAPLLAYNMKTGVGGGDKESDMTKMANTITPESSDKHTSPMSSYNLPAPHSWYPHKRQSFRRHAVDEGPEEDVFRHHVDRDAEILQRSLYYHHPFSPPPLLPLMPPSPFYTQISSSSADYTDHLLHRYLKNNKSHHQTPFTPYFFGGGDREVFYEDDDVVTSTTPTTNFPAQKITGMNLEKVIIAEADNAPSSFPVSATATAGILPLGEQRAFELSTRPFIPPITPPRSSLQTSSVVVVSPDNLSCSSTSSVSSAAVFHVFSSASSSSAAFLNSSFSSGWFPPPSSSSHISLFSSVADFMTNHEINLLPVTTSTIDSYYSNNTNILPLEDSTTSHFNGYVSNIISSPPVPIVPLTFSTVSSADVIATTTFYCTPSAVRRFVGPAASGAFMDQQQAYLSSAKFLHDAATPPLQALPTLERYPCNFLSSGSSELLSKMYDTALEKYEHMKQDYDLLRKKFTDLSSSYDTTLLRVERESLKIRAKLDAALDERSQLLRENFSLKQHLTFVTRRLELFEHEAKENVEHARRTGLQRDEAIKEMNHALALQIKSSKDLERRLLERNAAVQEYNLVMAERDTVHREIDKLNEELIEVKSKLTETVDALNVKTERMGQLESDRSLLSHEYDKLREEFHFFRAEYETVVSERDQLRINLQDFVSQSAKLVEERDALKQDKIMALEDRDTLFKEFYHKNKSSYADRESLYERLWTVQSDFLDTKKELDEAREQLQICAKRWDALVIEHDKIQGFSSRLKLLCDQLLERYGIDGMFCAESSHRGNPTRTAMENLIPFSDWSPSFTAAATFTNGLGVERLRRSPEWQMEILEVHRSFVDSGAISLDSGITFAPPPPPADPSITLGDYHHLNFGLRVTAVASESVFEGNIFGEDLIVAVGDTVISTNKDFDKLLRESLESGHGKTRLTLMRIHRSGNNNANVKSRLPYEYLYTRLDCNNSPPSSYLNGNNYKSFKPRPLNRRHSHLFKFKTIGTYPPRRRRRRLLDIVFPNTFINTTTTTTTTNNNNKKTSSMGRYLMNSSYPKRNPLPIHWMMKEGYSSNHHPHYPRFLDSFQLTSLLSRTGGETLLSYAFSEHGTTFAASAPHRSSTRTYRETIRESNLNHRPVISDGGNGGERHDVLHSNDDNNNSATLNSRKKRGKLSMKFEAYLDKFQEKILKKLTATNGKSSKRFNQLLNESFDSSFNSHKEESSELAPEKTKNKKYATKDRETNKPGVSFRPFTPKHRNLSPTERDTLAALDDVIGSYGGTKVDGGGGGTRTTSSSNEYLEESSSNATTGAATFAAAASMDVSSTNSSILDAHFGTDTNEVIIDMKHDTSTPPYDRSHDATNNGHGRRTNSGFTHYDEMTLNDAFNCQQHQQHGGSVKRKIVLSRREHHSNTFNNISLPRAGQQDSITFLPEFRATPTGLPEVENTNHPENVFSPPSFLGSIHVSTPLDLEDEDCVGSARSPPPPPRLSRPYNTVKSLISHYQQRQHNKIPISPPFTFENTWWPRKRGKERCSLFTSVFGSTDTDFSAQQPRSGSFIINGNRRGRKSHLNFPNATNSPAFSLLDYYEGNDGKTSNTTNTVSTSTDQSLLNSITSTAETSSLLPDGSRLVNFNCANNAQNQSCNKTSTPFMATLIRKRHKKTAGCTTITSDPSTKHYRYSAYYGGSIRPKISPLEDQFFVNIGSLDCLKSSAKSKVQPPTDKTKNQTQNVLNNDQELSSNFIDYSMEKNYEHSSNQFKKASKLEFTSLLNKVRSINIDKSTEPLGIKIVCITNNPNDNLKVNFYDSGDIHKGGIYVSSIEENSLAFLAGLQVGDQLLEICGINLRNATYSLAANVLRNCGQQMTILAQYNPTKYYSAMISLNVYEANDGSTNLTSLDKTVPTLNERHSYTDEYTTHSDLNFKSKCTDKNDGLKYEPSATVKVSKRSGTRKCNITNFEQLFLHPCQKDKLFDFTTRHSNPFTAIPRPPAYYNNSSSLSYSPTAKPNPPKAEESKPTYNLIDTLRDNIKIIQLTSFLYNPDTRRRHVNNSNELEMEDILPTASNVTGSINSSSLSPYQESYIKFKSLGLELVGGNKEGIFFKKINFTTPTPSPSDLTSITKLVPSPPLLPRCQGYQILEVNGKSTKNMTLEETIYEIGRSNEPSVSLTIHENLTKYQEILYKSCDLLYVRVLFDKEKVENIIENHHGRYGETRFSDDNNFLNFKEGQIFLVDESVANNMCWGLWRAWKLDERGKKTECGLIPSMYSLQQRRQALFQNTCHKNNVKKTCEGRGNVLTSTTTSNSGEENDPFLQREIFGFVTNDKKLTVKTTPRTTNSYDDEEIEIPWIKKNNNDYDPKIQCKSLTVGRKSRRFTTNIQKLFGPHKSFHWKQQQHQQASQFTLPSNVSNFDASPSSHNTINHDDASHIGDVLSSPQLYQGLRKIEICYARPIVLLGHFTVEITEKLVEYWSHKFQKFEYEIMKGSGKLMEQGIREEVFFTYNKKTNNYYEYLSNQSILTLANQKNSITFWMLGKKYYHVSRRFEFIR